MVYLIYVQYQREPWADMIKFLDLKIIGNTGVSAQALWEDLGLGLYIIYINDQKKIVENKNLTMYPTSLHKALMLFVTKT